MMCWRNCRKNMDTALINFHLIHLPVKKGLAKIADIMAALRVKDVQEILPDIGEIRDYAKGIDGLPAENVLKFILKDHSWIAVRPSGTEPKIKVYCSLKGKDEEETSRRLLMYKEIWEREFDL